MTELSAKTSDIEYIILFFQCYFERERERACTCVCVCVCVHVHACVSVCVCHVCTTEGQRERERENPNQAPLSAEPDAGINPMTVRSLPEPKSS